MPELLVARPDGSLLHSRPVRGRATIVVGRSPNCSVVVPSERASRHHAVIFEFADEWHAVDLDSTAGLQIESGSIRRHRFTAESPWVRMGPVVLWIDGLDRDHPTPPPTPIELRREPAVRTREDFVAAPPPPAATDAPPLLLCFRHRESGAVRLLDLAGADRVVVGGDHRADVVIPDDAGVPMRSLLFRVGPKWAAVDLTSTESASDTPGHRRLSPGGRLDLGPVEATVVEVEPVIRHGDDVAESDVFDPFEVPDLGSIFAARPGDSGPDEPTRPRKH